MTVEQVFTVEAVRQALANLGEPFTNREVVKAFHSLAHYLIQVGRADALFHLAISFAQEERPNAATHTMAVHRIARDEAIERRDRLERWIVDALARRDPGKVWN